MIEGKITAICKCFATSCGLKKHVDDDCKKCSWLRPKDLKKSK